MQIFFSRVEGTERRYSGPDTAKRLLRRRPTDAIFHLQVTLVYRILDFLSPRLSNEIRSSRFEHAILLRAARTKPLFFWLDNTLAEPTSLPPEKSFDDRYGSEEARGVVVVVVVVVVAVDHLSDPLHVVLYPGVNVGKAWSGAS